MRIGIVCPYNYFRPGGVQVCVRELAKELESRGHYVRVIIPRPRIVPENLDANIIMLGGSAEFNTPFATKADVGLSISNDRIDQLFQTEKFDVLHFHEPAVPMLCAQLLNRSRSANVGTMHASLPDSMVSKSIEKLMLPFVKYLEPRLQYITAVSTVAENTVLAYAPKTKVEIIPNGIALEDYRPSKKLHHLPSTGKKTIVYIGRLEKRKGVRYLLDAYAMLRHQFADVQLIIAGDGRLRSNLESKVEKNNIPDVKFMGFVSEEEKISLLQTADLCVSPAMYGESFGIILLEAMACGAVLVAGNNDGYSSVMNGKGRLSLVNVASTQDFAQRMELLLYDEEVRKLWLKWAKNHVQQFDYKNVVDRYEQAYKKAIKNYKTQQK